ncbi:MAG: TonB-dependent receptor plug domain-containing protein, partial [Longimicrobiales bacterium]|nr:TonB-dependent receptor plug domain-containing protein [Longimicrobiales bacterium]
LTAAEREVAMFILKGLSTADIAAARGTAPTRRPAAALRPAALRRRRPGGLLLLVALAAAPGCASRGPSFEGDDSLIPGGILITREQIVRSRARNGLEALERARTHLMIEWPRDGGEPRITHRGRDSLVDDGNILVILDGQPMQFPAATLWNLDAGHIAYMKVLSSREATPHYGLRAGNGAVYVRTRAAPGADATP